MRSTQKLVISSAIVYSLVACTGSSGPGNTSPNLSPSQPNKGEPGKTAPVSSQEQSLKAALASGKTLVLILQDQTLVSRINEKMSQRDFVSVMRGSLDTSNDQGQSWCSFASENAFVNRGDRFEVSADQYRERVYLGSERANFKLSAGLFVQCDEGKMTQQEFTLTDFKAILGTLVSVELKD